MKLGDSISFSPKKKSFSVKIDIFSFYCQFKSILLENLSKLKPIYQRRATKTEKKKHDVTQSVTVTDSDWLTWHLCLIISLRLSVSVYSQKMGILIGLRIISVIYLVSLVATSYANDILGCGGFVKSHVSLDFSKIEIGL